MDTEERKIKLISKEGVAYEVPEAVAKISELVKNMLEDDCDDDNMTEIPLPNVKTTVLQKVIEFSAHHLTESMNEIRKPLRSTVMEEVVQPWYAEYANVEQIFLFDLILAANYMNIKPLLDLTCAKVAIMIKGQPPEEIRKIFNITDNSSPNEEAQTREESKWCEEATSINTSKQLAVEWADRTVTVSGVGGTIYIDTLEEYPTIVKTKHGKAILLAIERAPSSLGLPAAVSFRVVCAMNNCNNHNTITDNDNVYLTNVLYSDIARQSTAEALASIPSLLSDLIPDIVDYCVDRPTNESNFEGAGFNYSPMIIQRGMGVSSQPNKLQVFELTNTNRSSNHLGVKSIFGTYWRSQHWNKTVSQSPHRLGDETWYFNAKE